MLGTLYTDIFNVTLSITPSGGTTLPVVTQGFADTLRAAIAGWWDDAIVGAPNTGGINITSSAKLSSIKLNRIGTDGLYMDPVAIESLLTTPLGGASGANPPPQLSLVATLRGVNERARAGKGRMYFPPTSALAGVFSDGRLTAAAAQSHAEGVRNLLGIINDVYITAGIPAVAGIASKVASGAFQGVETVTVGRVIDTMRSRRNKLIEDPQVASL